MAPGAPASLRRSLIFFPGRSARARTTPGGRWRAPAPAGTRQESLGCAPFSSQPGPLAPPTRALRPRWGGGADDRLASPDSGLLGWRGTGGVDATPQSPLALPRAPRKLAQLTLMEFPREASGLGSLVEQPVQGPYTFVLAKGSLFTKAWTNSSGPMCRSRSCTRREKRSREREEGVGREVPTQGLAWYFCGLPASQPIQDGLWTASLLPRAPQPHSGLSQSLKPSRRRHPSFPMPRGCRSSWGGAEGKVPIGRAWEIRDPRNPARNWVTETTCSLQVRSGSDSNPGSVPSTV